MRKVYLLFILALSISTLHAQSFRVNAYGNYALGTKYHVYGNIYYPPINYYQGEIEGGPVWGAGLEYRIKDQFGAELLYMVHKTQATADYESSSGGVKTDIKLSVRYVLAGGLMSFTKNQKLEPFGGVLAGASMIEATNALENTTKNETCFAWGLRGGLNYWITSNIGVKFQLQYVLVPKGVGGDLYFDSEHDPVAPDAYTSMSQFMVGGGLSFQFGKHTIK